MKIEYIIEHKLIDEPFYRKSFHGFRDKKLALSLAQKSIENMDKGLIDRSIVVEQTRKTIKVFK